MGVIQMAKDQFYDYVEQTLDEIIEQNVAEEQVTLKKSTRTKSRRPTKPESLKPLNYRPKSSRKKRRFENADALYMVADPEDLEELNIGHFMSTNMSAFAKLLLERENMKLWNDFINITEEDQIELVKCPISEKLSELDTMKSESSESDDVTRHPAYSPKECFENIDKELRQMLKRHVPLGLIANLEDTLMSFFSNYPASVYDCHLPDSYSRLMLHAVAQYHLLHCCSYDSQGLRRTKVKNQHEDFHHLPVSMSAFLEKFNRSQKL